MRLVKTHSMFQGSLGYIMRPGAKERKSRGGRGGKRRGEKRNWMFSKYLNVFSKTIVFIICKIKIKI